MIFYFSATGNSLNAAQELAKRENTTCVSIAEVMHSHNEDDVIRFSLKENEPVGFVVPTYFCGLPTIVSNFITKLELTSVQGHYVFIVMTYGAMTGTAAAMLQRALAQKNIHLSAAFSICTIDSYIPMFPLPEESKADLILKNADLQLLKICNSVRNRETEAHNCPQGIGAKLFTKMMYPSYKKGSKTSNFTVSKACNGCGLCEKVCPDNAITVKNGKPLWCKSSCTLCLGCLHRCPLAAIDYGKKTKLKKRYFNPKITAKNKFL